MTPERRLKNWLANKRTRQLRSCRRSTSCEHHRAAPRLQLSQAIIPYRLLAQRGALVHSDYRQHRRSCAAVERTSGVERTSAVVGGRLSRDDIRMLLIVATDSREAFQGQSLRRLRLRDEGVQRQTTQSVECWTLLT